jgi:hypothetical protein
MPSAYHVHHEFGYFCPTPYRRRELRVAIVSILFGAIIGGSIATLRADHDRNSDVASTASHVDVSNSERVPVAAAEAKPAAPNDADTKAEARESIKPFPIRRVRVRPAVQNPPIPATDATAPTQAAVVASASPLVESSESAQSPARFISRDEVGGGAAAFRRGQEAAKDRARSKPSPQ